MTTVTARPTVPFFLVMPKLARSSTARMAGYLAAYPTKWEFMDMRCSGASQLPDTLCCHGS